MTTTTRKAPVRKAAPAKAEPATKATATKATKVTAAPKATKTAEAPAKPRTNSRGMLLEFVGRVEPKGSPLAGYVMRRPFTTNELLTHPDRSGWVVRCVAHGTTTEAPNATEAERLGTNKVRPEWCAKCAEAAK